MEGTPDIIDVVSKLLDSGKIKEALAVPNEEKYKDIIKDSCWELITIVIEKIQDDTIVLKPSLYGACEQLLLIILEKCSAEEALLEFIERIELAKNDAQFGLVLPLLQKLLKKLSTKRGRSLEWSLNSVSTYIEKIPLTEYKLEGDERKLMDSDPNIRRVIRVYSMLPSFYRPFIDELLQAEKQNIKAKQIIVAFLVSLLGKPMISIDMDPNANEKSEARLVCMQIIQDICKLEKNLLMFLTHLEICAIESKRDNSSDQQLSPYKHREKINMTTLSGLFYIVYSGHFDIPESAVPQVYSTEYKIKTVLLTVNHLLNNTDYGPLNKGLAICRALTGQLTENTSYTILSASIHFNLIKSLINIAIYANYPSLRLDALNCIGNHIKKFDYKGKVMLIKYLITGANHSGMIGYAITQYKNALHESFKEPAEIHEVFTGAQLFSIIKTMTNLPHGIESDLMELADSIISVLNFLTYLVLKDKENITGIRDHLLYIETEYLKTLRNALQMSRAHYQAKLEEIKEGKNLPEENVTLNVGGNILDSIPSENKKEIIQSALNGFDVIEYLVARLTEYMN